MMQTDRKTEILDAFMRLVSRFGIDKTTMLDVAREVGISVGVIYKDFKNKEDLIEAYIQRVLQQLKHSCEQLLILDLPAEQLLENFTIELYRTLFRLVRQDRGFFQFINDEASIKYLKTHFSKKDEISQELNRMVEQILELGVREGVFEVDNLPKIADLYLSAFHVYSGKIFLNQSEESVIDGIKEMFSFIIRAIKKRTAL